MTRVQLNSLVGDGRAMAVRSDQMEMQLDITAPQHGVDISWSADKRVLWINVDGVCVLRVCQIPLLTLQGRVP